MNMTRTQKEIEEAEEDNTKSLKLKTNHSGFGSI